MLEQKQDLSFVAEFSKNIEIWVTAISKNLGTDLWLEIVPFSPKQNQQEQREFLRRAMIHLVTDKIQNLEIKTNKYSLPHSLLALNNLCEPGSSLKDFSLIKSSISHCKSYGVFACSPRGACDNQFIGVDLELSSRVTKEIINRVSTQVEVFDAPSAENLWTAKEASFKSLTENKTQVLNDLIIHSWSPFLKDETLNKQSKKTFFNPKSSWQYKFYNIQKNKKYVGMGWVISFADYTLAFSYLDKN
ncbi:MAG: 4'-phosphopantetheinyl transferase superfamily protein [Bdellovibrionales bacterium]|nr:4'-phosphopantetheinyl transferase superfamily protein [Bdellovibrionales bacterium]